MRPHNIIISSIIFGIWLLFNGSQALGQSSFDLNDPNIIYKDTKGNMMSKDSVISFIRRGHYGITKKDLKNGKTEITLARHPTHHLDQRTMMKKEWVNKWTDKPFPNFNVTTLDGNSISLPELTGNIVVIDFWFTGCTPCSSEIPTLNQLVSDFKNEPVIFLAFSFNDAEAVRNFIKKQAFNYNQSSEAMELFNKLGIVTFPTHMILDKKGVIKEIKIGGSNHIGTTLKPIIEKMLTQ